MHGIIMLGMPCSGKSSIGKQFAIKYGYTYISSGNIAREMASRNDIIAEDLKAGKMAPEYNMREEIKRRISWCVENGSNFVLDGFPRFNMQYEFILNMFPDIILLRVHIYVTEREALYRAMKRERADDASIAERIRYYKDNTYQLTDHADIFIDNNGERRDDEVACIINREVIKCVNNREIR